MKKLIFGCSLMVCGIIASSAWLIANAFLVEPGSWSSITNIFDGIDGIIIIIFFAVAVLGAIIAVRSLKKDN